MKRVFLAMHGILLALAIVFIGRLEQDTVMPVPVNYARMSHLDIVLPNMTLTDHERADLSLRGITLDTVLMNHDDILRSISPWDSYIRNYSKRYEVDADLVRAIIYTESRGDPFVTSRVGAQGLMQLMPGTADFMGIEDPLDPEENIRAGVKYISWLVRNHSNEDEKYLLWAWNAGPEKFGQRVIPAETKHFIEEVLSVKSMLKNGQKPAI
jgi:hypothetical protein